jgi:hypothetical protein
VKERFNYCPASERNPTRNLLQRKRENRGVMKPIPEEVVEKTWQEVAGFGPDRGMEEIIKIGNIQPELLAFMTESSEEMGKAVRELAIYMFLVVYRMFQEAHGKIKKISSEEIIACYRHNEGLMERFRGSP